MYSKYFGIKPTWELVVYIFLLLNFGDAFWKNVLAEEQIDSWEDIWEEAKEIMHYQETIKASLQSLTNCQ